LGPLDHRDRHLSPVEIRPHISASLAEATLEILIWKTAR
jgi:hypothetical protein